MADETLNDAMEAAFSSTSGEETQEPEVETQVDAEPDQTGAEQDTTEGLDIKTRDGFLKTITALRSENREKDAKLTELLERQQAIIEQMSASKSGQTDVTDELEAELEYETDKKMYSKLKTVDSKTAYLEKRLEQLEGEKLKSDFDSNVEKLAAKYGVEMTPERVNILLQDTSALGIAARQQGRNITVAEAVDKAFKVAFFDDIQKPKPQTQPSKTKALLTNDGGTSLSGASKAVIGNMDLKSGMDAAWSEVTKQR